MDQVSKVKSRMFFFYQFLKSPKSIGSITPSSSALINKMMSLVSWEEVESVVELGAGTGVITEAINQHMPRGATGIILERDQGMRQSLVKRFPTLHFGEDATKLALTLQRYNVQQVDCVISGLPFLNFSVEIREEIIAQVYEALSPGGVFVMFQYSWQLKELLATYFEEIETAFVLRNLPPAFVFACRKGSSS